MAPCSRKTDRMPETRKESVNDAGSFLPKTKPIRRELLSTGVHHNFVASYVWAIPFDRAFRGAPKRLTQGWQMQGITRFATGFPIHMNQSVGDTSLAGSSVTDMPDLGRTDSHHESAHQRRPNGFLLLF